MKRKARPNTWSAISPFSLYPGDLREVWAIVREVSSRVVMETREFSGIGSVDELLTLPDERIPELTIAGYKGAERVIEAQLDRRSGSVWVADDSASLVGALAKLQKMFWRHASSVPEKTGDALAAVGAIALIVLTSSLIRFAPLPLLQEWPALAGVATATFVVGLVLSRLARRGFVRIYLHPRPGFGTRVFADRREDWAIALVAGFAVSLFFFLLGLFVRPTGR